MESGAQVSDRWQDDEGGHDRVGDVLDHLRAFARLLLDLASAQVDYLEIVADTLGDPALLDAVASRSDSGKKSYSITIHVNSAMVQHGGLDLLTLETVVAHGVGHVVSGHAFGDDDEFERRPDRELKADAVGAILIDSRTKMCEGLRAVDAWRKSDGRKLFSTSGGYPSIRSASTSC